MKDSFTLSSATVGALPIVNHFLARLRFTELLSRHLPPPDARTHLDPAVTLGALLKSLILSRTPLYSVIEWASPFLPFYREERDCEAPTAARVFEVFTTFQRHHLSKAGKVVQTFLPELKALHRQTLRLLGIPISTFRQDLN